jgi:tripartite-type tricarboxylate transporter receptor subunit TctC
MNTIKALAIAATIALPVCDAAWGQNTFPSKTVRIVLPVAPGSSTDTVSRLLAEHLRVKWQQPVVIENISGGGLNIGAEHVYRSSADGYTLLLTQPGPLVINHLLYKQLGYEGSKFIPITLVTRSANVMAMRKDFPADTLAEFIAYAKANPGKVSYGSQGAGTTAHLSAVQLERLAGLKLVHVPYRGVMPALNDVMAGHIDMFFDNLATSAPLYRDNKIKILGVGGAERSPFLQNVPTLREAGLSSFRSTTWSALVAPPGTPLDVVDNISMQVGEIIRRKDVSDTIASLGIEPSPMIPADTAKFLAAEAGLWSDVIKQAGLTPQ